MSEVVDEVVTTQAEDTEAGSASDATNASVDDNQYSDSDYIPGEPIAIVKGAAYTELPKDLYIPPEALEVFLESFEGPLDLLLYLIRRHNLDILDIPIADITRQYMEYVEVMKELHFELAADYLVMAAMLAEIKSRMLLPRPVSDEEDEDDPRAELVRRLQEYERFKKAAEDLSDLPRMERDNFAVSVNVPELSIRKVHPTVDLKDLMFAFKDVLVRSDMYTHHHVQMEPLSVRERMSIILGQVQADKFIPFTDLFDPKEGRLGVVVTFLAILELVKESLIGLIQTQPYEPIHVTVAQSCQSQTDN